MTNPPDYRELFSSQIPALQVLIALGYEYLPPDEALRLRGDKTSAVILMDVLEDWLTANSEFQHKGRAYAFTEAGIRDGIRKLTDAATGIEGLVRTNERVTELLTLGTAITQTVSGDTRDFTLHYVRLAAPGTECISRHRGIRRRARPQPSNESPGRGVFRQWDSVRGNRVQTPRFADQRGRLTLRGSGQSNDPQPKT